MEAARAVLQVFGRYGCPAYLRSDQGAQFTASIITELLGLLGVERQLTLPYRPQANGIVERANEEVMRHLRALVMDYRCAAAWSDAIPLVQRIVNSSVHSAIGTSPCRLLFGNSISLDRGVLHPHKVDQAGVCSVEDYVHDISAAQSELLRRSKEFQDEVVNKRLADSPKDLTSYDVGDYVLVAYPSRPPTKLAPRWRGPMCVVEVLGKSAYRCQDLCTLKVVELHVSRLKSYNMKATDAPAEIAAADQGEWLVESVLDHRLAEGFRRKRGRRPGKKAYEFLVRWAGFDESEDLWLPYSEVADLAALDVYAGGHPELRL